MPAKSAKQERFMQAVAHNPKFAAEAGVPQKVGREFTKKYAKGGSTEYVDSQVEAAVNPKPKPAESKPAEPKPPVSFTNERPNRPGLNLDKKDELLKKQKTYAKGGSIDGCAQRGKTRAGRR